MDKSYYNFEIGSEITCPYCNAEYTPTYEETIIGDEYVDCYSEGERQVFTCDECNKKFTLIPTLKWEYETYTIEGEMSQEEWEKNYG